MLDFIKLTSFSLLLLGSCVDVFTQHAYYSVDIKKQRALRMEANILGLEQRIETLIGECKRLVSENRSLKTEQHSLMSEKTQLKEKNRLACSRLEKIIEKLRTLEDQ